MWPPTAIPKVIAGFTRPPEMFAAIYTADDNAKALVTATTTKLDASKETSCINFPTTLQKSNNDHLTKQIKIP
jgi:hypothetical protein